jgi:4-hydroxy-tetrahydrodipicolinate reductase
MEPYNNAIVGKDVGELYGGDPIGVKVTNDKEAIMKMQADVVFINTKDGFDYTELDNNVVALLESGKNVISSTSYAYPPMRGEAYANRFLEACKKGNSSLHGCGENPAMIVERLALTATCFAERLKRIEMHEYADIGYLANPSMIKAAGIGMSKEQFSQAAEILKKVWGPVYADMIGFMGMKLYGEPASRIKVEYTAECDYAEEDSIVAQGVEVKKGQALSVHQTHKGFIDGKNFITLVAHWFVGEKNAPLPEIKTEAHHVILVEAEPVSVRLSMQSQASFDENLMLRPGDTVLPIYYLAVVAILQAIPRVVDAEPGFVYQDAASYWQDDYRKLGK